MTSAITTLQKKTGRWEELSGSVCAIPKPSGDYVDYVAWLNSITQKCVADGFQVSMTTAVNTHSQLNSAVLHYTFDDGAPSIILGAGYGRTKLLAKYMLALTLDQIYHNACERLRSVISLERAGDSTAIGEPTAAAMPRVDEMISDTTVLALTNPVDTNVARPLPADLSMTSFSHSTREHSYATLNEREFYYGQATLSTSDAFGDIIPIVRGSGDEDPRGIRIPEDLLRVEGTTGSIPF